MSRVTLSVSQLFTAFGPGAMMDLPTRSVIVSGLDDWDTRKNAFRIIEEPRLTSLLRRELVKSGRWDAAKPLGLRTPPIAQDTRAAADPAGVAVRVFPTWFTCEGGAEAQGRPRRRRLVPWNDLEAQGGRKKYICDNKKVDVTPVRFVGACKNGHLQDIDWRWLVHRGDICSEPMWIEEEGTSADPSTIRIGCLCGRAPVSLADAFKPGFLGRCRRERPWLDSRDAQCGELLHFLSRASTNTYFPQSVTVVSLPIGEDALTTAIQRHWSALQNASDPHFVNVVRHVPEIGAGLTGFSDDQVFNRIKELKGREAQATPHPKLDEFDLLASGKLVIGIDGENEPLFAETLSNVDLSGVKTRDGEQLIDSVVAVHRLRAVTALYGFTRLEPAPTMSEALLEDVQLFVDGAPISEHADWLPAMEQKGEGIFMKLSGRAVRGWLARQEVQARGETLNSGLARYVQKYKAKQPHPGLPYIALHGLAHALMSEISLECGYPFSSLRERVYADPGARDDVPDRFGILIYTASAGAQGTLGGLVESAPHIPLILLRAVERLRLCSNDPVCADHNPSAPAEERSLHGAACHACLLVPETSCEARNQFLDRALLVETLAQLGAGLI